MKTTLRMMLTIVALLGTTPLAYAAATAAKDGSHLAIMVFLGMCALIVVVQLFPVLFMAYGLLKGLVTDRKHGTKVTAEVENSK